MYSPLITDKRLFQAKKAGLKYKRMPREKSIEFSKVLQKLRYDKDGKPLPDGNLTRQLTTAEQEFIDSERLICKCDFPYFFTRYSCLELDPGVTDGESGIAPPVLLESQHRYITLFGRREEQCYEELKKYKFTVGILAYLHKVRQVTATATVRGAAIHRMLFWPGTRCFAASLDSPAIGELFKRDHIIIDNLPWWLAPSVYPDVKDTEIGFRTPTASRINYRAENGENGIGTGTQNDFSHLTEVALWHYPGRIRYSFVPGIPKAVTTFHVQESTADGRGGYWHEVTEAARHQRGGYENWIYAFIPWYMNKKKYRDNVPDNWEPTAHTVAHAELIERTSPEFFDGVKQTVSREQLYWWEKTRDQHVSSGELASFLTNYPATPEQSFQSASKGALPIEVLERMEQNLRVPEFYDMEVAATQ